MAIQGGLGNQLSQWYFAHTISVTSHFRIDPLYEMSLLGLRNFELSPIMRKCSHIEKGKDSNFLPSSTRAVFRTLDKLWRFSRLRPLIENLGYFREDPRFDQDQSGEMSGSTKYFKGYFQNQAFVQSVFDVVEHELLPIIRDYLKKITSRLDLGNDYTVIHVRRGDYAAVEFTPTIIGSLSDEYFIQGLLDIDTSNLILLTENREDVADLVRKLKPRLVLDKSDTTPWETLAIMYGAARFIGSNSSLSWWGARICSTRGGQVWLPSQWSYWKNVDVGDYHFPKCNIAEAFWGQSAFDT